MAQIRNLHWWTVEYGLIGDLRKPKIFGAGLLSSISESYNCLQDPVKKIPYSIAAAQTAFDITTQQPQLFVTPDFAKLSGVLEEFASGMALRKGGIAGLEKARETGEVATVVWSSGLQASGIVGQCIELRGEPVYIRFSSATALSYNNSQIEGHGKGHHAHGFGSPAGRIEGTSTPPERMTDEQINAFTDKEGITTFRFESGVEVSGTVSYTRRHKGLVTLISFTGCRVTFGAHTLFDPDWGIYDMAVGEKIISVFPGPADPSRCSGVPRGLCAATGGARSTPRGPGGHRIPGLGRQYQLDTSGYQRRRRTKSCNDRFEHRGAHSEPQRRSYLNRRAG